ncbi:Ankyrin repeats 3 copy [Aspergillus parasiticus SU-1]|uniref:Ankyrin repeats 3 copy n=1 Tax=Aspergillus parasiticus (strain ATCC 56775 / NRRL 5862 / SRRC 143 / SU-1) TaxID=1403190 RepID=A0A0F0I2F1_ASPPU|nr:Ankyrin repeats 3 copy [Aspergillus parasiticus SU-1]
MRSWLSQLMFHTDALGFIREKWESTQGQGAARGDVLSLLRAIVSAIPECTFILDGLDECDWAKGPWPGNSDDSITSFLRALRRATTGTSTRIMIVSRDEPEMRRGFSNENPYDLVFEHRITPEDVQNDVLKLKQDTLRSGKSQRKLEQVINSTPSGIEHIYERNWMKIMRLTEEDRTRAFSLLRWTAFSLRPLTIGEISGALVISEDEGLLLDDLPDSIDEDYVNTEIIDLCGSLLDVRDPQGKGDARLKTVHLAHFSVKEYLLRNLPIEGKALQLDAALSSSTEVIENMILAKKCLRFVNSQEAWLGTSVVEVEEVLSAFRKYAAGTWHQHAELGDMSNTELMSSITTLFGLSNPNWAYWKEWGYHEQTPLGATSGEGNLTIVRTLLEQGADVAMADIDGWTPIYTASRNGHTEVARLLIEFGANVNIPDNSRTTPVNLACGRGHVELVKLLLKHNADINTADIYGWTPINSAAYCGYTKIVELLFQHGADITIATNDGITPLHIAIYNGHTEIVEFLLEHHTDINTAGINGWPPINTAAYCGHTRIVELLLNYGADISTVTNDGITPLYAASAEGHIEVVKLLLKWGADIDYANKYGDTPLSASSSQGYLAISKILVATGADIEAKNNFRRTPLHLASLHGHIEIVILLLERGADVEAKDTGEWTPLINASFEGHAEVVNALLERGADIEAKGTNEYTPLMYASAQGHIEVVRLLLNHGADLMDCDRIGNTSLHLAAYNGQAKVVEILLETSSTHVDALIRLNRTPLFQAATRGHLGVVNIFLSHKANANIKDHYCSTPLFTAARNGHKDVIERLIALAETPIHFQDDLGQGGQQDVGTLKILN